MFNIYIYIYISMLFRMLPSTFRSRKADLKRLHSYIYIYIVNSADIVTHDLQFCKLCSFKHIYI